MKNLVKKYAYLSYQNNVLYASGVSIKSSIKNIKTPFFVFLPEHFKDNYDHLKEALSKNIPNLMISYAVKANYLGRVLSVAKNIGMGVEVMSMFELKLAEKCGFTAKNIIFNGPAKTEEELKLSSDLGIDRVNVDSLNELKLIEKISEKSDKIQHITVRIHPNLSKETEKRMLIKKNSKLGIDFARAVKLYRYASESPFLEPLGVHVHVGTNIASHSFYEELLRFLDDYIKELEQNHRILIKEINLGGGLTSRSELESNGFSLEKLGSQITDTISNIDNKLILFELGRYFVGDSFIALTKVLRTKKTWGRKWAFTDIGANSLIPMRYTNYEVLPMQDKGKGQYCRIGGPLCLPVDVLSKESVDFKIEEEDYLVILNCGAYTLSMSEQFGYPRPAVYELQESGLLKIIKSADNLETMVNEAFQFS